MIWKVEYYKNDIDRLKDIKTIDEFDNFEAAKDFTITKTGNHMGAVRLIHPDTANGFDIDRDDLYEYNKPKERTRKRLTEIAECGMEEIGIASFGYKGVVSGLYIEMVWVYSDEDFKDYMDWAKGLIAASLNKA